MKETFLKRYNSWAELEQEIESLQTNNEKGDAFEEFVHFYFLYHSNLHQIADLYCPVAQGKPYPVEVLERLRLEKKDHGVDGVFVTHLGQHVAFQAKFRSGRKSLTYDELSTFWTEAEYADVRLIISNTRQLPDVALKKAGHTSILSDAFESLDDRFFESLQIYATNKIVIASASSKSPRPYQITILDDLESGLANHPRGTLVAACGIGKTLIALWLLERRKDSVILFLAPSLQLIRQTLGEWAAEASEPFQYLCVCSDQSVSLEDETQLATSDLDVPVTTNSAEIRLFLLGPRNGRRIIFSTYQSVPMIADAVEGTVFTGFDITFFDEAHRTAGTGNSKLFSLALQDTKILSRSRLFMTATERVVRPRTRELAAESNQVVFSMDDVATYGPNLHRLTFGEAIQQGIVSDYRIVFAGMSGSELAGLIASNRYVLPDGVNVDDGGIDAAQNVFHRVLLRRCFEELDIRKVVTFHGRVSQAKLFARSIASEMAETVPGSLSVSHVNGQMTAAVRGELISHFEASDCGILTNVRCLTEGVDIPLIDGVFFGTPRDSTIDIVQAVGRALRKPFGSTGKMAYVIIPFLLDEQNGEHLSGDGFETLFNVIQAMRDQDKTLAEWIDHINHAAVTGRKSVERTNCKLKVMLPATFDVDSFDSKLHLQIADVNRDPAGTIGPGSRLGQNERQSSFTRRFKTLCDYRPDVFYSSLVEPTMARWSRYTTAFPATEIKINNNNVSHCERLGVIRKVSPKEYCVTPLGKSLQAGRVNFIDLFRNQILLYSSEIANTRWHPYREAFRFMKEVRQLGFAEFVYGIYSLDFDAQGRPRLQAAIERSKTVRKLFPRIEITSAANRPQVLDELNRLHPVGFSFNDVWTDRTTTGNQYRYLTRHLEVFDEIFTVNEQGLSLKPDGDKIIDDYLGLTEHLLDVDLYGTSWWLSRGGA
jgi:superfamily II DNA or RNA helicase